MPEPFDPPPKQPGDVFRAAEWNAAVQEVRRLGAAKLDRDGPATLQGPLTVDSGLTVGGKLVVNGRVTMGGKEVGGGWWAWQERLADQEYTAEADGLVTAWLQAEGTAGGTLTGETPAGTPRMVVALPPPPAPPPPEPLPPVLRQRLTLTDSLATDNFGHAVAVSGDIAVIGVPQRNARGTDSGAAYVYVRQGEEWVQQTRLLPDDVAAGDLFGRAVAVSGNTAVIGSPATNSKDPRRGKCGAAYVFVRKGEEWKQQFRLEPDDGAAGDNFGDAVAVAGDTAVIGAHSKPGQTAGAGAAYVFVRKGEKWLQQPRLVQDYYTGSDSFGKSVAVSGDTVVIGAPGVDSADWKHAQIGAAFVYVRRGEKWDQQARLLHNDPADNDQLGNAVAVSGDTAVIGAWVQDTPRGVNSGATYVFVRRGEQWVQQARLKPDDLTTYDNFGNAVAIAGDTAVIGAWLKDVSAVDSGMAYVFVRRGGQWVQQAWLVPGDAAANDSFGNAVAVSGETALIGAWKKADDSRAEAGAAYIYHLPRTAAAEPAPRAKAFTLPVRRGETWVVRLTGAVGPCTARVHWLPRGTSEGPAPAAVAGAAAERTESTPVRTTP